MMRALRYDAGSMSGAELLDNGWLRAPAYLSRAGIFEYRRADGSVCRELRPPDEVFSPDALKSFGMVPLTDEHPLAGKLDAENTRSAPVIGHVGDTVARDGDFVAGKVMVTDAAAVERIRSGQKTQLSCGYVCDVEETPGTWEGQAYDCVQRNIRGNHVALVSIGRAGPDVRVRLDTGEAIMVIGGSQVDSRQGNPAMLKFKIDGIEVDISEVAAQAIAKERDAAAKALASEKSASEKSAARADAAEAALKKAQADLAAATDPAKMRATVKARVALERQAGEILGDESKFDEMDDGAIREAVVKHLSPEADLTGKSAEYVAARYDAAVELAVRDVAARVRPAPEPEDGEERQDAAPRTAAEARRRFEAAAANAYRSAPRAQ